ncbi:hypothetical protein QEH54_22855, partial [Pelagicoccus sp. SDUM812003]
VDAELRYGALVGGVVGVIDEVVGAVEGVGGIMADAVPVFVAFEEEEWVGRTGPVRRWAPMERMGVFESCSAAVWARPPYLGRSDGKRSLATLV